MTSGIAPSETTAKRAHIGSFDVIERLMVTGESEGQVSLRVEGSEAGDQAGHVGIASCFAAPTDEASIARVKDRLARLRSLSHPALDPVIECGYTGSIIYWVRSSRSGETLALHAAGEPLSIEKISEIVTTLAGGLQAAHNRGLAHGSVSLSKVQVKADGSVTLIDLGIKGRGPAQDQHDLGMLAIELLARRPWVEPDLGEHPAVEQRIIRAQHLRQWLEGSTERITTVLNRATEPDPVNRFESIEAFAAQFSQEVRHSAEDLAHGAFEAISARNYALADVLTEKAKLYDPQCESLSLLDIQLHGGSLFAASQSSNRVDPTSGTLPDSLVDPAPPTAHGFEPGVTLEALTPKRNVLSPQLTAGLPAEFLESIVAQLEVKPVKKSMNPTFVLILGGLAMVILLLIAALVTMSIQ